MSEPPVTTPEEARERARRAVAGAFAKGPETVPVRRCPTCGHEAATLAARCPNCNKRYDRALPWLKDWMRWTLGAAVTVALVLTALALRPGIEETKQQRAERQARAHAAAVAAERARLVREQRPVRGRVTDAPALPAGATDAERRTARRALVLAMETAITEESQRRIEAGRLDGPVKFTECGPLVRAPDVRPDDAILSKRLGRYDCVAVKRDVRRFGRTVALFGHPFVGTIDFRTGRYVFCKDNKVPGERGKALATVTLEPECLGLDEDAERVGDGYAQPGE